MTKKPDIKTFNSGYASNVTLNENFKAIQDAFDNTLSLDGSTPNTMGADLDLDGYNILNADTISCNDIKVNGEDLGLQEAVEEVNEIYQEALIVQSDIQENFSVIPKFTGPYASGVDYEQSDLYTYQGSTYIVTVAHTSGATPDFSKAEMFAQKGQAGVGLGDMLAENNLSDLNDFAEARDNLGLGDMATKDNVSTSDLADSSVTQAKIADTSVSSGKIVDGAVTFAKLADVDTTVPTSGASASKVPTTKAVADRLLGIPFTKSFASGALTWTAKTPQTISHSLGARPKIINLFFECEVATASYSVGDFVGPFSATACGYFGISFRSTVNDITFIATNGGPLSRDRVWIPSMTGGVTDLVPSRWKIHIEAYA